MPEEKLRKLIEDRRAGRPTGNLSIDYGIPYDELQEVLSFNKVHPINANLDEVKDYIAHNHPHGTVLSDKYVNVLTPVKLDCGRGHAFEITPVSLFSGRWCQECFDEGSLKSEMACKAIVENIFSQPFVKSSPDWLKNAKGYPLHLDMMNTKPINLGKYRAIAIEYNGEQHYKWIKRYQATFEEFIKQQENDRQKRELCKKKRDPSHRNPVYHKKGEHARLHHPGLRAPRNRAPGHARCLLVQAIRA
ncbi:MAG: hypothetical protein JW839_02390 [Candidatus Lokiarchaeota archaeon]|nr:hypothetical protein [Candidatus Lokiarchaeota archaeon]